MSESTLKPITISGRGGLADRFQMAYQSRQAYRDRMQKALDTYETGIFYAIKDGEDRANARLGANLIRALADKNVNYMAKLPTVKVPPKGTSTEDREHCEMLEKVVYGTQASVRMPVLQKRWAFDTTTMMEAYAVTDFNVRSRKVRTERYDPRFCYPVWSNTNDRRLVEFFVAFTMTKEEIRARWEIDPDTSGQSGEFQTFDNLEVQQDGKERYWVVGWWNETHRAWFTGNAWIEQPHEHHLPYGVPVDVCQPFYRADHQGRGGSFFEPLYELQAEYNETMRRKANIIRRLGSPTVYAKAIFQRQLDELKDALKKDGGAFGIPANGEVGVLQLQETKALDDHMDRLFQNMKDIAGYPTATFGEVVGANTSGDALSMYFQPTAQATENQWIDYVDFHQSIIAKQLQCYEKFGTDEDTFKFYGYRPSGTIQRLADMADASPKYSAEYAVEFTHEDIAGYYQSVVIPPKATPKDEVAYKRLLMEAAAAKVLPLVEVYEEWGIISPQDTLDLLKAEQSDAELHPENVAQAAQAAQTLTPDSTELGPDGQPLQPAEPTTPDGLGLGVGPVGG